MKIKLLLFILNCILSLSAWSKFTLPNKKIKYKGEDITQAVKIWNSYVQTLKKEYTVFHWDESGHEGQSEEMVLEAKKMAKGFWSWYGNPETEKGGYFGYGLYAATDPVITNGYGSSSNWSLMQIKLPKGSRVIDFNYKVSSKNSDERASDETEIKRVLMLFDCKSRNLYDLFSYGGWNFSSKCSGLVQRVFQEFLKVDALIYPYHQTMTKSCKNENESNPYFERALVVLTSGWMNSDNVKFYTKDSTYDRENRIRIQTLFLKNIDTDNLNSKNEKEMSEESKKNLHNFMIKNLDKAFRETKTKCDEINCNINAIFCNKDDKCEEVEIGVYPLLYSYDSAIKSSEAMKYNNFGVSYRQIRSNGVAQYLLWSDLEGEKKATDITSWVKESFFGCNTDLPYEVNESNQPSSDEASTN